MINLEDYPKFKRDLEKKVISVVPLVIIDSESSDPIFVSTQKGLFDEDMFFEEYDLDVSSIVESLDLRSRRFHINNMRFSLSNYVNNAGYKFSDYVYDRGLLNKYVEIYYKTPSCTNLSDCLLIYKGLIRKFEHSYSKVDIELEDLTEGSFKKKLPVANIKSAVYALDDKHINQKIPMVYGSVDKAPAIPWVNKNNPIDPVDYRILCDDLFNPSRSIQISGFTDVTSTDETHYSQFLQNHNPLYIEKGELYKVLMNFIPEVVLDDIDGVTFYDTNTQYSIGENNVIEIVKKFSGAITLNPPYQNEFQCLKVRKPNQILIMSNPDGYSINEGDKRVFNIQETISTPELAFDNPADIQSNTFINEAYTGTTYDPWATKATIPSINAGALGEAVGYEIPEFSATGYLGEPSGDGNYPATATRGVMIPVDYPLDDITEGQMYSVVGSTAFQHKVYAWVDAHMNWLNYNEYDEIGAEEILDPRVVYQQLPNAGKIMNQLNRYIHSKVVGGDYTGQSYLQSVLETEPYEAGFGDMMETYTEVTAHSAQPYQVQFEEKYRTDWHQDGADAPSYVFGDCSSENQAWWYSTVGDTGGVVDGAPFPQCIFLTFVIDKNYRHLIEAGSNIDIIYVSMDNTSFNPNDIGINDLYTSLLTEDGRDNLGSKFVSIFESEDHESLFSSQDFASFIPTQAMLHSYFDTPLEFSQSLFVTSYRGNWNGITSTSEADNTPFGKNTDPYQTTGVASWYGDSWGGGAYYHNDIETQVEENEMSWFDYEWTFMVDGYNTRSNVLSNTILKDDNHSWVIWVKKDIPSVGHPFTSSVDVMNTGYPDRTAHGANNNLKIAAGTMMPIHSEVSWVAVDISNAINVNVMYYDWVNTIHEPLNNSLVDPSLGDLSDEERSFIINSGEGTGANDPEDNRLSIMLPLPDLDIQDELYSSSFFSGKLKSFINPYSNDSDDSKLLIQVGAIDSADFIDGAFNVEWDEYDGNYTSLIEKTFSEAIVESQILWSTNLEDNVTGNEYLNMEEPLVRIRDDWSTDEYSGIGITCRAESEHNSGHDNYLGMALEIYDASLVHFITFKGAMDNDFYADVKGRVDSYNDAINYAGQDIFKYTGEVLTYGEFGGVTNQISDIEHPADIIYHIVEKEIGLNDMADYHTIQRARIGCHTSDKYAFSVGEEIEAQKLIEDISHSSSLVPTFRSTGRFGFFFIQNIYGESDVDFTLSQVDVIDYKIKRTDISLIYTAVNVAYKKDYKDSKHKRNTGYVDGYDFYGNGDGTESLAGRENGYSYNYLNLKREDNVLEFQTDYIRDDFTAINLRNFLFAYNANQHNIFELTMPIKYINLEVGDIIKFDELIDNVMAYGEDYTEEVNRNGQTIYPYFIITKVDKRTTKVLVICEQLHSLEKTFTANMGSVTRMVASNEEQSVNMEDFVLLQSFLHYGEPYFTRDQKRVSDMSEDGYLDNSDLLSITEHLLETDLSHIVGDSNLDGNLDVADVITYINAILSPQDITEEMYEYMDLNEDGIINAVDVIILINALLGN